MPELHRGHKAGVDFPDYGGLVPPARVAPDKWLSGLPEDWQIVLVKHIFAFNEKGRGFDSEAILSLTQRGILERDISGNEGQLAESYENYPQVLQGDFVLNPMDLVAGWVARTNISGKVSGAYYSFHITNHGRADGRFFEYLFQAYYRERIFDPFGSGLGRMESGGGRWTLGRDVLMNFPVPLPPINGQRVLAAYLDEETSQIDLLISKKEQLIEKLLERRQALITQAVTKGLDPDVPMKDSGVEWLGQVPDSWEVIPLKRLVKLNTETLNESTDPSEEIHYVEIGNVSLAAGIEGWATMRYGDSPSRARRVVREGDVLISTVRTYLKAIGRVVSIPTNGKLVASTGFAALRPVGVDSRFLELAIASDSFIGKIQANSVGVSYPGIDASKLISFKIALPPKAEQNVISNYLDAELGQISELINRSKAAIELLRERRQALITQVVTGKLEVRGFAGGNS